MTDYALELTDDELDRYRQMAERARAGEEELWDLAGVHPGAKVADVGCGPGAVTALLGELVGPAGHVWAVDGEAGTVAAAQATVATAGLTNATCVQGDATDTGLEPGSLDVVMMRHVLAHNPRDERRIVEHLATLVRPGGCVCLVDGDLTSVKSWPPEPDLDDLTARYLTLHEQRGSDLKVGLRLDRLLEGAGLEVLGFRGRIEIIPAAPGFRGPAWAARDALVGAGLAGDDDLARWSAMFERVDRGELRFNLFVAPFCAVGRRQAA